MVEQCAVNALAVGSNPSPGAKFNDTNSFLSFRRQAKNREQRFKAMAFCYICVPLCDIMDWIQIAYLANYRVELIISLFSNLYDVIAVIN